MVSLWWIWFDAIVDAGTGVDGVVLIVVDLCVRLNFGRKLSDRCCCPVEWVARLDQDRDCI